MTKPILTICIAAYNVETTINRCIDSIIKSGSIEDLEILVIDDGGQDSTLEIVKQYKQNYPDRIKIIHKTNGGYGSVINKGISIANGKYFKQLDGDDWFSDKLVDFINLLKSIDVDLVLSSRITFNSKTSESKIVDYAKKEKEGLYDIEQVSVEEGFGMHCVTYKTTILKTMNKPLTEKCFYTDVELVYYPLSLVRSVFISHLPVYVYSVGTDGQSVSISGIRKHIRDHEIVFWNLCNLLKDYSINSNKYKILYNRLVDEICGHISWLCLLKPTKENKKMAKSFLMKLQKLDSGLLVSAQKKSFFVKLVCYLNFNFYMFLCFIRKNNL